MIPRCLLMLMPNVHVLFCAELNLSFSSDDESQMLLWSQRRTLTRKRRHYRMLSHLIRCWCQSNTSYSFLLKVMKKMSHGNTLTSKNHRKVQFYDQKIYIIKFKLSLCALHVDSLSKWKLQKTARKHDHWTLSYKDGCLNLEVEKQT